MTSPADDDEDFAGIPEGKPRRHSREHALEEVNRVKLIKACNGKKPEERVTIVLAMYGGMRANEIAHLRADPASGDPNDNWIRFQQGVIVIPERMKCERHQECRNRTRVVEKKVDGEVKLVRKDHPATWMPKTAWGARTIPFTWNPVFKDVVTTYFTTHEEYGRERSTVYNIVKRVADRAGIPSLVYPHALRATAASMLADKNVSDVKMRDYMGWSPTSPAPYAYIRKSGAALRDLLETQMDGTL